VLLGATIRAMRTATLDEQPDLDGAGGGAAGEAAA
jgi:hypothetical protein